MHLKLFKTLLFLAIVVVIGTALLSFKKLKVNENPAQQKVGQQAKDRAKLFFRIMVIPTANLKTQIANGNLNEIVFQHTNKVEDEDNGGIFKRSQRHRYCLIAYAHDTVQNNFTLLNDFFYDSELPRAQGSFESIGKGNDGITENLGNLNLKTRDINPHHLDTYKYLVLFPKLGSEVQQKPGQAAIDDTYVVYNMFYVNDLKDIPADGNPILTQAVAALYFQSLNPSPPAR